MKNEIRDLVIAITYNCNSRCRMCHIWQKDPEPGLALSEIKKIPDNLTDINITGGEPFLRQDLLEIIKILVDKNPKTKIIISSNGFATGLIKKQMTEILKIKPDIGLALSLDGLGKIHDQVRGVPGGYALLMATVWEMQKLGVKNLKLAFTAADYNIDQLNQVYQLSRKLGLEFTLAAVHNADNYFSTNENKIEKLAEFKKEFEQLINSELKTWKLKNWGRAYFAYGLYKYLLTGQRVLPNYSGQTSLFIDPQANVYPADVAVQSLGNLKEFTSLAELTATAKAEQVIEQEKNNQNWMICTARTAIKNHKWQVMSWVFNAKLLKKVFTD